MKPINKDKMYGWSLLIFLIGYPPSVYAAGFFDTGPMGVEWVKYGYVLLMSSWGAAAALLQRFAKGQGIKKWKIVAARDFVNATLAAVLTFWICEHFKVPMAIEAVAFTLAAYGGARFMESMYGRFVETATTLSHSYTRTQAMKHRRDELYGEEFTGPMPLDVTTGHEPRDREERDSYGGGGRSYGRPPQTFSRKPKAVEVDSTKGELDGKGNAFNPDER